MYNDLFQIGKITIHGYGLMIGIGFALAVIFGARFAKRRGLSEDAVYSFGLIAIITGFLGGKLLYIPTEWKQFIASPRSVLGSSGFVVYGGIVIAVAATFLYAKLKKLSYLAYLDTLIPFVALAQGFGRIGCFLAGCCYGSETDSFLGVIFPYGSIAPSGIKLLPTQLFSSAGDFLLFLGLLLLAWRVRQRGVVGSAYLIAYGIGRFAMEFLRGDDRGVTVGPLSISQFISLFFVLFGLGLLWFCLARKPRVLPTDKEEYPVTDEKAPTAVDAETETAALAPQEPKSAAAQSDDASETKKDPKA